MRLLFVADGRSPTALAWIGYWIERGDEVHLVSTYPCEVPGGLKSFRVIAVAFGGMVGGRSATLKRGLIARLHKQLLPIRYLLGPASLLRKQKIFTAWVQEIQPDLVHALRIPYEGMLACRLPVEIPFIVSIWGNDLTLHARGSRQMGEMTRKTLARVDALMADTQRDLALGTECGLALNASRLVVPGAGGIRRDLVLKQDAEVALPEAIPPEARVVVNPRGHRPGSLRQDLFFRAIPEVLKKVPEAYFICPPLGGDVQAEAWVASLGIGERTRLWPKLTQGQLWMLMRKAQLFVSPSLHDGTPNSLLEAMTCGCLPVVGDIAAMHEWVTDGENGLLVDANDSGAIAEGIIRGLNEPALRTQAAKINAARVAERANHPESMERVRGIYEQLIKDGRQGDYSARGARIDSRRS